MSNVIKLPIKQPPFCTVVARVEKTIESEHVTRLREPLAIVLGLDSLSCDYLDSLFNQFFFLNNSPMTGPMIDRITWNDFMPRVCAENSPILDLPKLTHVGIVIHNESISDFNPVNVQMMQVTIDKNGASWSFVLHDSHYHSVSIPLTVFKTARERYHG